MEENKIKVVTTKKACELLECSRTLFYLKYKPKLKQLPPDGRRALYLYDEVMKVAEEAKKGNSKFEIIG